MKLLFIAICLLLSSPFLQAQNVPYNVVFDLTSKDTADHQAVMRWLSGISSGNPDAKLEVVLYGGSLDMVQKGKSTVAPVLLQLLQNKNVKVKVCAVAMKHHNIEASQLLPGVDVVPDGIYEIIQRQKDGWGYIKATH
jgi:intracellular sulfur oxidation DsrE/DsrF family protein